MLEAARETRRRLTLWVELPREQVETTNSSTASAVSATFRRRNRATEVKEGRKYTFRDWKDCAEPKPLKSMCEDVSSVSSQYFLPLRPDSIMAL